MLWSRYGVILFPYCPLIHICIKNIDRHWQMRPNNKFRQSVTQVATICWKCWWRVGSEGIPGRVFSPAVTSAALDPSGRGILPSTVASSITVFPFATCLQAFRFSFEKERGGHFWILLSQTQPTPARGKCGEAWGFLGSQPVETWGHTSSILPALGREGIIDLDLSEPGQNQFHIFTIHN